MHNCTSRQFNPLLMTGKYSTSSARLAAFAVAEVEKTVSNE